MKLNFKTFGQGEPLIILHGLLGSLDNWQTLGKKLAKNYTVFLVDQRNHGRSPHSDEFSYDILAEDLLCFMEDNYLYKAHLLGHSMGGKTVMQFALQNPDMVDKLIVADIAPVKYIGGHEAIFNALLAVDLPNISTRKEIETQLATTIKEFGVRQFLMKGLTRGEGNIFEWKFNLQSLWNNYKEVLGTFESNEVFEGETLFLKGGNSKYILADYQEQINTFFPDNQIQTIEGAGHWLHAEKPMDFLEKTLNFLQS
ncbi:MAG: alpha/beta fold hydrolase [Chitinophagales bacterium]